MRLFHNTMSPYVRKVMIVLHETGQLDDVEIVFASGTALDASRMPVAQNPLGKVPTLEREDGPALYDSRVICRYLDARAGAGLYPNGKGEWDALTIEATADGILDACLAMVYERRVRPPDMVFEPWVEGQWAKVERALGVLEQRWLSHLNGPFSIAHVAVICALGYIDFRLGQRNWRASHPELATWFDAVRDRDSVKATTPSD